MTTGNPVLPGERKAKPAGPELYPVGTAVNLRNCPGEPGRVRGFERGRLVVYWASLHFTGKHKPDALILAADAERPIDGPQQGTRGEEIPISNQRLRSQEAG